MVVKLHEGEIIQAAISAALLTAPSRFIEMREIRYVSCDSEKNTI